MTYHYTQWVAQDNLADHFMDWAIPLIEAHPAWTQVGSANDGVIFENDWQLNSLGQSFYVSIRKTSETRVVMGAGEGFDSSNNQISRPCPGGATGYGNRSSDGSYDGGTSYATNNTTHIYQPGFTLTPTDRAFLLVSNDAICTGDDEDNPIYVGLYDDFHGWEDFFPLVVMDLGFITMTTSNSPGRISRHISHDQGPASTVNNYAWRTTVPDSWTHLFGVIGDPNGVDPMLGKAVASRVYFRTKRTTNSNSGDLLGLFPSWMLKLNIASGVNRFDTVEIDGNTWVYITSRGSNITFINTNHVD